MAGGDLILSEHDKRAIREVVQRMLNNEPGLYRKQVGRVVIVDKSRLLRLQKQTLRNDIASGRLVCFKKTPRFLFFKEDR